MVLGLSLSSVESNDNTTLTLTDDAGDYSAANTDGWGAPNLAVGDLTTATLDIVITTADGTETTYDQIDLVSEFGAFVDIGDLVFPITSALLLVSGVALGVATDELPDGLYDIVYDVDSTYTYEPTIPVYGQVQVLVYEKLRELGNQYNSKDCISREIQETTLYSTYLDALKSISSSDTLIAAKSEEFLSMLSALNSMVVNGSRIVW